MIPKLMPDHGRQCRISLINYLVNNINNKLKKECAMNKMLMFLAAAASLSCGVSQGAIVKKGVEWELNGVKYKGELAYDDAKQGKLPAIAVFPEWYGVNDYAKGRADQLAGLGYVALAADVYGNGKIASGPEEAGKLAGELKGNREEPRKRAAAAVDALKKQENVDPGKVAAIGYCFGGTTVLELARMNYDLKGVVSFHGGLNAQAGLEAKGSVKPAVLVCHGVVDPMVSPEEVLGFEKEMNAAKADYQLISYADSVHGFTNPGNKDSKIAGVGYNEKADKRSWAAMIQFLKELLQ